MHFVQNMNLNLTINLNYLKKDLEDKFENNLKLLFKFKLHKDLKFNGKLKFMN